MWDNHTPGSTIPTAIKAEVRERDKVCQLNYPACTKAIDEFDHPHNLAAQGRRRVPVRSATEVVGVCTPCHRVKTQREARQGRRGWKRPPEPHPGIT